MLVSYVCSLRGLTDPRTIFICQGLFWVQFNPEEAWINLKFANIYMKWIISVKIHNIRSNCAQNFIYFCPLPLLFLPVIEKLKLQFPHPGYSLHPSSHLYTLVNRLQKHVKSNMTQRDNYSIKTSHTHNMSAMPIR